MNSVILIFLDGVGIGEDNAEANPFFRDEFDFTRRLFGEIPARKNPRLENEDGMFVFPADANLETEGLPQSGTGQTAILCGVNASRIAGKHFGPFPHSSLLPVLENENIYSELAQKGFSSTFANAYPPKFFEYLERGHTRLAATTKAAMYAGLQLNGIAQLQKEEALSHEIDNSRWKEKLGLFVEIISPEKAASNLLRLSERFDFVFYEYFFTDHWGHGRNLDFYNRGIKTLNSFLLETITNLNAGQTLLICSDHGNFEDLSVKSHTRNPVFMLAAGEFAKKFSDEITSITEIKNSVIDVLNEK